MTKFQLPLLAVIAMVAFAGGCKTNTAPSPGMGDPYPAPMNDPQISVLSPELQRWLVFQPAIITKDGQRPMTVEVPVRNTTYNQYLIEYRILFYDRHGRELSPVMGWEFASLDPKQVVRLKRSAMTTEAETYRMEVRWSR
jgi:uncharacterized protein YcfL